MTETVSNVYDLTYPSPITLKEISSIVVAVELWRKEISAQLESKPLQELDLKNNILLRTVLPNLPSKIYSLLEKYVDSFRKSMLRWLAYDDDSEVFSNDGFMYVLSRFDDFAWDWDGTIHEVRTAKRMMMCDRLTEDEKFKIACLYCFEDDIKQIWPSVSETIDLNEIDSRTRTNTNLHYWISYLTISNELHSMIPFDELIILSLRLCTNHSSVVYFWNRLPSDSRLRIDTSHYMFICAVEVFARFILPKLSDYQLDLFGAKGSVDLMHLLLNSRSESTLVHVLPTWMYIQSRIDITSFSNFIIKRLEKEAKKGDYFYSRSVANSFGDIWDNAPQQFKRPVLDTVLHNDELCRIRNRQQGLNRTRGLKFLITVLRDAAFEERNAYWHNNWRNLIFSAPVEDLVVMMQLSFRNENEITLFKENIMSIYENIAEGCAWLLKYGLFEELNEFLSFCCLDELRRMDLKQRLLRSNYVGENSVLTGSVVENNKSLNEFIGGAFRNAADLGVEFRNQLTSSPVTQNCLFGCIYSGSFVQLMEFVDTFYADEHVVVSLKKRLFEYLKEHLIAGETHFMRVCFINEFLIWLLGSEDEVVRFKQSIPVEEVFRTMMQAESRWRSISGRVNNDDSKLEFPENVDRFLMWYFNKDEEEIEKFIEPFHNEFESFVPRKRRKIA